MKLLQSRDELQEKQYCSNLFKGYDGEVLFDSYTSKLECECLVINDLLLQYNNTTFQIDTLIITPDKLYIFEVKNYECDYFFESDILYKKPKKKSTIHLSSFIVVNLYYANCSKVMVLQYRFKLT